MDTKEINTALRRTLGDKIMYLGIYCSDNLPKIPKYREKPMALIANTLKTTDDESVMGHWVAFLIDTCRRVIYFDSYGLNPNYYNNGFSYFLDKLQLTCFTFGEQYQPVKSIKCGLYVMLFIHYISHYGLQSTLVYLRNILSVKYKRRNDVVVTKYYFKYINKKKGCGYWKILTDNAITYKECMSLKKK